MTESEQLRARWKELVQEYRATCRRRPQVKVDCDAAYTRAWQAWQRYAHHQEQQGLPVEIA